MKYAIYIPNGQITKIVEVPEYLIDIQISGNEQYIQSDIATDNGFYVENNTIIAMPPKKEDYFVFDYTTKTWIDPRTPETQWPIVRQQRDQLLQASDYTQLPDVPLNDKAAWATYRQELRDITNQPDPFNIIWPTPPQG